MQTYLDAIQVDPDKLNYMLACLWHRGKEFNIDNLERDAMLIKYLPERKKMVMYWFVSGCLSYLSNGFPRIFSGGGTITHNVFDSQMRLLDTLANSDMTKKDSVRKGNLMDALYTMDEIMRRNEEIREKTKSR